MASVASEACFWGTDPLGANELAGPCSEARGPTVGWWSGKGRRTVQERKHTAASAQRRQAALVPESEQHVPHQKLIPSPVNSSAWLIFSLIRLLGQLCSPPYQPRSPLHLWLQLWPTEISEKEKGRSFAGSIPSGHWKLTTDLVVSFIWGSPQHVYSIICSFLLLLSKAVLFCLPRWSKLRLREDEWLAQPEAFNARNPTGSSQFLAWLAGLSWTRILPKTGN